MQTITNAPETSDHDVVLIHGAWHGSWAWQRLIPLLQAAGIHRIHTPTLLGMGETAALYQHRPSSRIGVRDQIAQVQQYIALNNLHRPYLIGHSYGGVILNGLLKDAPDMFSGALFLDAAFFTPSTPFSQLFAMKHPPTWIRAWNRQVLLTILGNLFLNRPLSPPPVRFLGLDTPEDQQFVTARLSGLPSRFWDGFLKMPPPTGNLTYVRCTGGDPVIGEVLARYATWAQDHDWHYVEIPTGHDCMISAPDLLAPHIIQALQDAWQGSPVAIAV